MAKAWAYDSETDRQWRRRRKRGEGELARHSTFEQIGPPHCLDINAWKKNRELSAVAVAASVLELRLQSL